MLKLGQMSTCETTTLAKSVEYLDFLDFRMCVKKLFYLQGVNVLSTADDHVLYTTGYPDVSFLIHHCLVSV